MKPLEPRQLKLVPVGTSGLAFLLGITPSRVRQLVAEGVITREDRGRFALADSVRAYTAHQRARAVTAPVADGSSYDIERTRLAKAKADAAEVAQKQQAGELISVAEVVGRIGPRIVACKSHLRGLHERVKRAIPHLTDEEVVRVRELVDEALTELADRTY